MTVLFVADLHLDAARPRSIDDFVGFTRNEARTAESLYILGDLFEAWVGDDDDDPALAPIIDALRELTLFGTACHFMHGNRDFLVAERFCERTGIELLAEFERIDLQGETVLLTHGDLLCTDDVRYLELRRQLRNPAWQRDFLGKPLAERRQVATDLRQLSQQEMARKSEEIMDVNADTVIDTMRRFGVRTLIHGHTHRPAIHRFEIDGDAATRVVLDDWYGSGGYVSWDRHGPKRHLLGQGDKSSLNSKRPPA